MKLAVVGHVTYDMIYHEDRPSGWLLGGTASYVAFSLAGLGARPWLISKVGWDFEDRDVALLSSATSQLRIERAQAPTTRFELRYVGGRRGLRLLARCEPLSSQELQGLEAVDALLLGPVAGEVELGLVEGVARAAPYFTAALLQGFLRRFDPGGVVRLEASEEALRALSSVDLLCGSEEEVLVFAGAVELKEALRRVARLGVRYVAATMGKRGSWLYADGVLLKAPSYPGTVAVDPTGAGDAYAGVLALLLASGEEPSWSVSMATAVASFVVETLGPVSMATRRRVEERALIITELLEVLPL